MDNLNLNKHISGQFNAELESIRTQVMTMGGMVEQQLSDAITAMHNQDSELAKRVIEGDHNVNIASAPAAVGKPGIAGPPHRTDAA